MIRLLSKYCLLPIAFSLLAACDDPAPPVPRPRSYPRVDFPAQTYQAFTSAECPFTFQQPTSASAARETNFFEEDGYHPCWFDLRLDDNLNGQLHFSYYEIDDYADFEEYRDQAFELTGVHNKRASDIEEVVIHRPEADVHGIAFEVTGPAASPFQFFLTDSTDHFVRAALYFNAPVNPDSIRPVADFVKEDIFKLVETFAWKTSR